jgi:catechol 2,3-dioxygenase-like lactoylglutathione lyase family enzyme
MKKVPTDFRRVTMMVSHMESALTIYRDILGMEAYYDQEVEVAVPGAPSDAARTPARLVILKCNDPYIGMLGLMKLLDGSEPVRPPRTDGAPLGPGEAVFVMQHENVEVAYEKLREVEGVRIVNKPEVSDFKRSDGGVTHIEGLRFFDPNGYFIDLNQVVE